MLPQLPCVVKIGTCLFCGLIKSRCSVLTLTASPFPAQRRATLSRPACPVKSEHRCSFALCRIAVHLWLCGFRWPFPAQRGATLPHLCDGVKSDLRCSQGAAPLAPVHSTGFTGAAAPLVSGATVGECTTPCAGCQIRPSALGGKSATCCGDPPERGPT
jgi:hypothetical protein